MKNKKAAKKVYPKKTEQNDSVYNNIKNFFKRKDKIDDKLSNGEEVDLAAIKKQQRIIEANKIKDEWIKEVCKLGILKM